MKLRPCIITIVASLIATTTFAAKVSHNECLAHWETHVFEDRIQMGDCDLNDNDMLELSRIVYKRHIKFLNLSHNAFTAQGLKNLASHDNGTIKLLWLNNNNLGIDAVHALRDFYAIDVVSLSDNPLGNDGVIALASNRRLNEIYIHNTDITSIDAMNALARSNLEVLSVENNHLTDAMIEPLVTNNNIISYLSVANNDLTHTGAENLSRNRILKELHIEKNRIGDAGIAAFANNSTLELLKASHANITRTGILALARNTTLKKIDISHNSIDDESLSMLARNSNIVSLDASYTQFGQRALVSAVDNTALTSLFIDGNHINDDDAKLLALSEIQVLGVNDNDIGHEGGIALAKDLTLKKLYINRNHVGDPAAFEFANSTTLSVLMIMYNGLTQAGMNALSDNIYFDLVWYGETPATIKKINRLPQDSSPFLSGERLIKSAS